MHFCQPCHNDAMANQLRVKSDCEGGPECPLGLAKHPKADMERNKSSFPLGCSLCRSEKLGVIADKEDASTGVSLEKR